MPYLLPILTDEGELFYVIGGVTHGLYFVLSGLLNQISGYFLHLFKETKYRKLNSSKTQGTWLRSQGADPPPSPRKRSEGM